jgi:hypothetical protein
VMGVGGEGVEVVIIRAVGGDVAEGGGSSHLNSGW